jgi:hypothetical protein
MRASRPSLLLDPLGHTPDQIDLLRDNLTPDG